MKKCIIILVVLFSGTIFSQEIKPILEPFGKMVRATYFHENGQILQQGFYENGKLQGVWVAFDEKGNKTSSGEYAKGLKTGKWFFWSKDIETGIKNLCEVDYSNNIISDVKNWKQDALVSGY